ncbi:MAG: ATP-binding protein [Deltaproteobacteria bacterium]|nr:ATP-binding protein [Deltaproteobacteria bacterium]
MMKERNLHDASPLLPSEDLDPLVRKVPLKIPTPVLGDNRGDVDRVLDTLERTGEFSRPVVSLPLAEKISDLLHTQGYALTLTVGRCRTDWELLDVEPGDRSRENFGVAVDLGSTNIVYSLIDLTGGRVLEEWAEENPQVRFGEDILSRIHHCRRPEGLRELQQVVIDAMNREIGALCDRHGIDSRHIYAYAVAGNTTMIHLLLGLSPLRICREPYLPVVNRPDIYPARTVGLTGNSKALLYSLPNVGSYVGGDVIAGILVSGMHRAESVSILVDVGTNAEIVLGNREWLMVAAGAAGPALEGGVVRCGMRAADGAIESVRIDGESGESRCTVIGDVPPVGICGSGLIDLMAELFRTGVIDERGKFASEGPFVVEKDGVKAYRVVPAEATGCGEEILLTELDINNLLRTKGAMYTALTVITRYAGVSFGDLEHFHVAGTFGGYIDPESARNIGMLPDIPLERYRPLKNSSVTGACLTLLSNARREELDEICRRITYVELNVEGEFMSLLSAALFLPHTDRSQFPSVRKTESID